MLRSAYWFAFAGALISVCLAAQPAQAQATRTFVSGHGTDTGGCPLASPCRTFAYAIGQTATGGEIAVLDTAGYGPVTITNSVSIVNSGGVEAGIAAGSGATAITVNTGSSAAVSLRGLTIEGAGIAANGIVFIGDGTLEVLDCTVRDMTNNGISVTPSHNGQVLIANTTVAKNAVAGIFATGDGSGSLTLTINHSKIVDNGFSGGGFGFRMTGGSAAYAFATIDSSLIAQNGVGLSISQSGSNTITAFLVNTRILNNAASVSVGTGASIKLERTSIATAFSGGITNNGTITSFGDNAILDTVTGNALSAVALK
jgi:hypothetical protein